MSRTGIWSGSLGSNPLKQINFLLNIANFKYDNLPTPPFFSPCVLIDCHETNKENKIIDLNLLRWKAKKVNPNLGEQNANEG